LQGVTYYRGDDPAFVLPVMEQFGFDETVSFFEKLGIYPKSRNGYYYPASEQAASVLDVLRMELTFRHVSVVTECELRNILEKKNGFLLETDKGRFSGKKIIFATGLLAAPKTGSDGSAIPLIKAFGHRFSDVVPALVALQCRESFFKQLAGIRTEAEVSLFIDGENIISERGELQLTDYGISGIPVFQVSRFATKALKKKQAVTAQIDFLPRLNEQETEQLFEQRFREYAHGKIGSKSFEQAQVCAGGVHTDEIDPKTMESRLVPNIYFAGEVVDIDGMCGGYNLQWAWSSGYVAGRHAAE